MSTGFPHFNFHREARCFSCANTLFDLSPTEHAPGHGHYRGECTSCGYLTWYDCAEGSVELIQQDECSYCGHRKREHRLAPNGAWACARHACGCRDVVF